jgi:hypothetical protein
VAQTGNMYTASGTRSSSPQLTFVIGLLFVKETKDVDIYAEDNR